MSKVHREIEKAARAWCDDQAWVKFVSYRRKSGNHGKVVIEVLTEKVIVTAMCTPRGGVDHAIAGIKKTLNKALRRKIDEFENR